MGLELRKRGAVAQLFFLMSFWAPLFSAFASEPLQPEGYIGSVELEQIFELVHLVDCRSRFEYDILHMKNAVHVPVGNMVREDLELLRAKDPAKAIVFYGNGEPCPESRAAFVKAAKWGYTNIFSYRGSIFNWAKERPEKARFWGEILGPDSQDQLFAADHFLENSLPPGPFLEASQQAGTMVVDIRDMAERSSFSISLPNAQHFPIDRLVKLIKSGSRKVRGKRVFIIDCCGGRSQWLAFVLVDSGIDYVFLKGGVAAWRQAGIDRFGNIGHGAVQ